MRSENALAGGNGTWTPLIYSYHHYDHMAGGKAFKDAGATIIAHKKVTEHLAPLKDPNTPLPDQTIGDKRVIKLGGTSVELLRMVS